MRTNLSPQRVSELLSHAASSRIAVVGDAMLDVYLVGDVDRISPEAPVPVVRVSERRNALGGAANVAQNVAAIGARCDLVATVGDDRAGDTLHRMLEEIGAARSVVRSGRSTTQKMRIVARSQQLVRVDEEEDADLTAEDVERVMQGVQDAVAHADALILEDYNKGMLVRPVIREAIDRAVERRIPIVVDPKFRNFFHYSGATLFKPNRRELEAALGAAVDLEHPEALPDTLRRLGVANILLTLGERGMILVTANGETTRIPTTAREVFDVVGAGDTVTAYLAAMLASGATTLEAATIANAAAGIEVGKLGAVAVPPAEVQEWFDAAADGSEAAGQ
jgi:D-beta-D-heptose 7-phosphate kinase/D-beta-D-heptose 1-phosphate adenosyltransferase